ncbi:unnamed protein product [Fusarium graminearum]|uniref:Chromosome 1, complete genome n=1 Tax=Gibberella zeae (strain ATCC MYA-4620 / CBS 123657 / FGSC 9075 / NRRL 31084 / PH-1) TaxID=229533 RepID=I1S4J8_GIBZE|nr:hypothetical protein FGSG_11766 [Fusarium graminearum PH-1]ESU05617.1 hypothetical protein FGSG_11766 [Fusarium graminearum PH-1]CEF72366.1 unnamed protein product [Fusarium graminearum]CZS75629.1 unnamed protein product [Fusarium graminearum]|eukprot:XP_011316102.1 hypothetical protein FGSG_11766 [Fusarium graminearum PH-1]
MAMAMLDMMPSSWCCVYSSTWNLSIESDQRLQDVRILYLALLDREHRLFLDHASSMLSQPLANSKYITNDCTAILDDASSASRVTTITGLLLSGPPTARSARSTLFDRQAFEEPATHLSRAADHHVSYQNLPSYNATYRVQQSSLPYGEEFQDIS